MKIIKYCKKEKPENPQIWTFEVFKKPLKTIGYFEAIFYPCIL